MRKMKYQNMICEVEVVADASIRTGVPCRYGKGTIKYAVERFFSRCTRFCREFTKECCEIRFAKGKARHSRTFSCFVPSVLMELPGEWVRLAGWINEEGVHINRVELLKMHPYLADLADAE